MNSPSASHSMTSQSKPRLLLTGASGFLGFNVYHQAKQHYQILGIAHSRTVGLPGMQLLKLDITQPTGLRNIVRETRPDAIIHLAAVSDVNYCQLHPDETNRINVRAAIHIAQLAAELAIPIVFTSTDMVFDGKKGNYNERDAVSPINHYGEQKVLAEEGIARAYPEAAICRMPLMLGPAPPTYNGLLQAHLARLRNGEPLQLFTDEYRSPLFGVSAAAGLVHALNHFKGLYHLGGSKRLSRYELGVLIAKLADIASPNIIPTKQAASAMPAPRPKDVSFDSSKALAGGFKPAGLESELVFMLAKK